MVASQYVLSDNSNQDASVQLPVWSNYLCDGIVSSVCFEITLRLERRFDGVLYNL